MPRLQNKIALVTGDARVIIAVNRPFDRSRKLERLSRSRQILQFVLAACTCG